MNILFVSPYIPYPPSFGGSVRIYNLARSLAARQHNVTVVSYQEDEGLGDASGLAPFCDDVVLVPRDISGKRRKQLRSLLSPRSFQVSSHFSPALQKAVDETIAGAKIDVVIVEFSQMAGLSIPDGPLLVVDEHNVEYDLLDRMAKRDKPSFRRFFNAVEVAKFRREELEFVDRSNLTLTTSERDARLLMDNVPGLRTAVITNGVDLDFFARPDGPRKTAQLIFVGAVHYFPNEDGVRFFMDNVFQLIRKQRPDVTFKIVGGRPPPTISAYASDAVDVTGFVDDVRPYMWDSSVFVVPLRMGGGTRFKIVEALAAHVPVVSTRLGAEGIPVTSGNELVLADEPGEFAEAVVELLDHGDKAAAMAERGYAFVKEHFSWNVIGHNLESAIRQAKEAQCTTD